MIRIESNGATANEPVRDISVTMNVADFLGDYKLTAKIDTVNGNKADLHNPRIFMSLYRDADGLKAFADFKRKVDLPLVLTPHAREYEILTGNKLPDKMEERAEKVQDSARKLGAIIVL